MSYVAEGRSPSGRFGRPEDRASTRLPRYRETSSDDDDLDVTFMVSRIVVSYFTLVMWGGIGPAIRRRA